MNEKLEAINKRKICKNCGWCIYSPRKVFKISVYSIIIPSNMHSVCVIQNPHKPKESVALNPVALGKAVSKGDEENLNLITMNSVQ